MPSRHEGGVSWVMDEEARRRCLCHLPVELSLNEWSVFINLEPLPCQKERLVLEGGKQTGGGEKQKAHLNTTSLFIFHTHTPCSSSPSPQAGQFTVRLFNFPEIGLWQLCHDDEKSGSLSHLIYLSSAEPPPPPPVFTSSCLYSSFRDIKPFPQISAAAPVC